MAFTSLRSFNTPPTSRLLHLTLLTVMAALLLSACKREQAGRPAPPPAEVEVYVAEPGSIPVTYEYIGQTQANQQVEVRSRVQGVVWEQGFEEGTSVTAGQFLYLIDPRPFEADNQVAEARSFQAKVAVQAAQRDLNRTRTLTESASVAREELDDATSLYETSVASLRLADAQLLKARLELSYTTITAPISGMVGLALKKTGDLVDTAENSLLCIITAQDPMFVNFSVSEKDMLEYRNSQNAGRIVVPETENYIVEIVLLDGTVYRERGRINFSDVTVDPNTGTAKHRAVFPNPKGLLQPGQYVEVHIIGAERTKTIMVPQRAVMFGMQGSYVYIVDEDDKVGMRPVTATDWEGKNWIIEDGIEPGEQVIISGINKTAPGADVKVTTVTTQLDMNPETSKENGSAKSKPAAKPKKANSDTSATTKNLDRMPASPRAKAEASAQASGTTQAASAKAE